MNSANPAMSQSICSVTEVTLMHGVRGLRIENDLLSATVLIDKGADIYALVYKPLDLDVLWKTPWGLRAPGHAAQSVFDSEAAWLEHYAGGWQVLFPNGGNACTYKGAQLNFHGEASVIPWRHAIVRADDDAAELRCSARLFRSPFTIERTLRVERGVPALVVHERVTNVGGEMMDFMWGHHPAFGAPFLSEHCVIDTDARSFSVDDAYAGFVNPLTLGSQSAWPIVDGVDLSRLPALETRRDLLGYLSDFEHGWYAVTNTQLGLGVGLVWPKSVFPHAWFWQDLRGSAGFPFYSDAYVAAIEPFTSIPGQGLEAVMHKSGTQRTLAPGASLDVELRAVFFESHGGVSHITPHGRVSVRALRS